MGDKVLLPTTLSPVLGLADCLLSGAYLVMFLTWTIGRELVALVLGSTLIGLLLWQGLLLALIVRFWRARLR